MYLFKIQNDLIADRTPESWYRLMTAGTDYNYRWSHGSGPDGGFSHIIGEHYNRAVCREDPSLTLSWGLPSDTRDDRSTFEWATTFIDTSVRVFWADFFWNGALIDRVELASVDGGHGTIPVPDYEMKVTHFEEAVAWLVHDLGGRANHDNPGAYLKQIGASVVHDQRREGAGSPKQ